MKCGTIEPVPDWLPPFLAASLAILLLNLALLVQRRRESRDRWERRLLRELRAWTVGSLRGSAGPRDNADSTAQVRGR